jgi:NAD(P)H-dependent flavin oxidoreductase YrpB (nitropropane dioxygenase family)
MAGAMAMGAQGVWTGTVWLATTEAETSQAVRDKMVAARSGDTVRSRARSGKPNRQLKSAWNAAWDNPGSPGALPLPLMPLICTPAMQKAERAAEVGSKSAMELVTYESGQGVGMIEAVRSARGIVQEFREDFARAFEQFVAAVSGERTA